MARLRLFLKTLGPFYNTAKEDENIYLVLEGRRTGRVAELQKTRLQMSRDRQPDLHEEASGRQGMMARLLHVS